MKLAVLRVGVRLATRELRRAPTRTALVLLLVAIPTGAMTVVTTLFRSSELSREGIRASSYGAAQYLAYFNGSQGCGPSEPCYRDDGGAALLRSVVPGTPTLVERHARDRVRTAELARTFSVTDVDLDNPLVEGRLTLRNGRPPRNASEAAVAEGLAADMNLRIGSTFEPQRLGRRLRVVGLLRQESRYDALYVVTKGPLPSRPTTMIYVGKTATPPSAPGWSVDSTVYTLGGGQLSNADKVLWTYVAGAIGLLAMGTIVSAAFAIGARRQLRTIGLLAATGASPRVIRVALTAQGAVAGVIGSVAGVAIGLVGVRLLSDSMVERFTTRRVATPVTRLIDLIPIVLIGAAAATAAAGFPARTASGISVLQALGGRRPTDAPKRLSWRLAAGLLAAGTALLAWVVARDDQRSTPVTLLAILGGPLPFISALVAAPLVVAAIERLVSRASLTWRIAGRSLARNRARSAAVVGATCAVAVITIALPTYLRSLPTRSPSNADASGLPFVLPNHVVLNNNVAAIGGEGELLTTVGAQPGAIPETDVAPFQALLREAQRIDLFKLVDAAGRDVAVQFDAAPSGAPALSTFGSTPLFTVAKPDVLDFFGVSATDRDLLRLGDALILVRPGAEPLRPARTVNGGVETLHVVKQVESPEASASLPQLLISPSTAAARGWRAVPAGVTVLAANHTFTSDERRHLRLANFDLEWKYETDPEPPTNSLRYFPTAIVGEPSPKVVSPRMVRAFGFGGATVVVLAVVAVGLMLSARDNRDEHVVLNGLGAPPAMRRGIATRRAALLVGSACVISVPAGLIPVAAIALGSTRTDAGLRIDWLALVAVAAGLPLMVAAATALGGWARDRLRAPWADPVVSV